MQKDVLTFQINCLRMATHGTEGSNGSEKLNTATVNSHRLYTLVVGKNFSIVQFRDVIVTSIFESVSVEDEQATLSPRQTNQNRTLEENQAKRGHFQVGYNEFTK
ncbi:hypothetical protein PR048_001002 [Dryococelus australis]|uniref:Uncharacterized protein n=1 Tax=Dryococelus australis TaxID=614101 RepID=A0ABQ9IG90_9NEOP|nr:hypothetical protein PR048_001002 [Dryococelus australis]